MNSGRFGFVSVPGTKRPARTFAPTFFANSREGFWPYWRAATTRMFSGLKRARNFDRSRLDAEASERHGEVGDRVVRRLTGPVRHDGCEPGFVGQVHRGPRLGERPNLVRLNKDSVARSQFDSTLESLHVRDEDVVADDLASVPDAPGEIRERTEVLLVERIFDAEQSVIADEPFHKVDLLRGGNRSFAVPILPVAEEFGGGQIERRLYREAGVFRGHAAHICQEGEGLLVPEVRHPRSLVPAPEGRVGAHLRRDV